MIEILRKIAEIDEEINKLENWLKPQIEIHSRLNSKLKDAEAELRVIEEKRKIKEREIRGLEDEITILDERRAKEAKKLEQITSVKAAKAGEAELFAIAAKKTGIEDKMLGLMEELEEIQNLEKSNREALSAIQKEEESARITALEGENNTAIRIDIFKKQKEEILIDLKPEIRKKYEALIESGIIPAIAFCDENVCLECTAKIKPNVLAHIKAAQPAFCDHCRRILIVKQ